VILPPLVFSGKCSSLAAISSIIGMNKIANSVFQHVSHFTIDLIRILSCNWVSLLIVAPD